MCVRERMYVHNEWYSLLPEYICVFIIVIMIPVWFDSDSVCFFSLCHSFTHNTHWYSKRPLFRCVSHIRCACGLLPPLLLLLLPYVCCVYVCIGNSEYNVFIFDLVNCWLHAKQHRMLYGPVYAFPIFDSTIHSYGIYRFVCISLIRSIRNNNNLQIVWLIFLCSTRAWHLEFCSFNLMYHRQTYSV